jgi:hypothetical protein
MGSVLMGWIAMSPLAGAHSARRGACRVLAGLPFLACLFFGAGCAAVSNPVSEAIPVRRLPPEVRGPSKEDEKPVPVSYLRQKPNEVYKLAPGDVLGIWIGGVLGELDSPPPVRLPDVGNLSPAVGFPIPVRDDGTIPLPRIDPLKVQDLSVAAVQKKIIEAYTLPKGKDILKAGNERVIVTLMKPRTYHVLVLREDGGAVTAGTSGGFGVGVGGTTGNFISETRRVIGVALDLPAYENDVLNALTRTGGLPGFEAENEVIIERGAFRGPRDIGPQPPEQMLHDVEGRGTQTLRIPLRVRPETPVNVRPEDIVLETGDAVIVRVRRGELFYTGGLLPSRAFPLPRDRDLDVLQALALVGSPIVNGGFNANNLNGNLLQSGIGFPSPSQVTVLRRTADGSQIPILVSINRALRDPRERINIQPGDFIVLQQTYGEALAQYITTNLRLNFLGTFIRERDLLGTGNLNLP